MADLSHAAPYRKISLNITHNFLLGAIRKQLAAFLEGFYEIIPKRLISIFTEQELELLISGLPTIDIDDLKANTEYHKYQSSSIQVWMCIHVYYIILLSSLLHTFERTSIYIYILYFYIVNVNADYVLRIYKATFEL